MTLHTLEPAQEKRTIDIESVCGLISRTQRPNGEIPWSDGDKTDPWDLVEAAMGLNIGGRHDLAERAFEWMIHHQLQDGSWYSSYRNGEPEDRTRDTNMSSYIAVGALQHFLITGDTTFLKALWPTVKAAINFALSYQAPGGEIYWASSPEGVLDRMALLTGSSSVFMSLKCALAIAHRLGQSVPAWEAGLQRLGYALRHRRHHFNLSKSRYSMDWFYPVLCGALTGADAQRRIDKYWDKFVIKELGVLCVSDEPWVTMAETSELVLALNAMGDWEKARIVFSWILERTYEDGSYWCGFTHPDIIIWPEDKITWTNSVVLMAADAVFGLTPASGLYSHRFWQEEARR